MNWIHQWRNESERAGSSPAPALRADGLSVLPRVRTVVYSVVAMLVGLSVAAPRWWVELLTGKSGDNWWRWAAFNGDSLCILALLILLCILFFIVCRAIVVLTRRRIVAPQAGTAIIEFALLFPVALLLFLVILQTAFLYTATFYVNLAAYRAARAAIVWAQVDAVPAPSDDPHTLILGPQAIRHVENAAIFTCLGISGTSGSGLSSGSGSAMDETWKTFIGRAQGWSGERLQRRYAYARDHTRVRIETMRKPDPNLSEWNRSHPDHYRHREPITVQVSHDFELAVPYAKTVLGERDNQTSGGGYRYIELRAAYTLVNEGQPELNPNPSGPAPGGPIP